MNMNVMRLAGAAAALLLSASLGGCIWTSNTALLTSGGYSPLPVGDYRDYSGATLRIHGEGAGPIYVTAFGADGTQTGSYSVSFYALDYEFYLAQAVPQSGDYAGWAIYELVRAHSGGFTEYKLDCGEYDDGDVAWEAGATISDGGDCYFADLETLATAARWVVDELRSNQYFVPGYTYNRM